MEKELRVLLAEVPTNRLMFAGRNPRSDERLRINLGPVDTNLDKPTQMLIAGALKEQLPRFGYEPKVCFFDGKALPPDRIGTDLTDTDYQRKEREIPYAGGTISVYRLGKGLECIKDVLPEFPVLGLTANFSFEARRIGEAIAVYRRYNPHGKVIVGGRDATFRPEVYLGQGADAVVLGEGEQIAGRLVVHLHQGKRPDFPGVAFREGGAFRGLGQRPILAPINELPLPHFFAPDEHLREDLPRDQREYCSESQDGPFPPDVAPPTYHFFTSRGCIYQCSFCTTAGHPYDAMTPDNVRKLLRHLKANGVRTLLSAEDAVAERIHFRRDGRDGRQELLEIMQAIKDDRFAVEWTNAINFNLFHDGRKIDHELMDAVFGSEVLDGRRVGSYRMSVPVERPGGDPRLPKLKPHAQQIEVIEGIAARHAIASMGLCAVIRPEDSAAALARMKEKLLEMRDAILRAGNGRTKTRIGIFCLTPHPGSKDAGLEALAVFPRDGYPELRHYFAPVLDGRPLGGMNYDEMFWELLALKKELDPDSYASWVEGGNYAV
jgi:hypothetical protein